MTQPPLQAPREADPELEELVKTRRTQRQSYQSASLFGITAVAGILIILVYTALSVRPDPIYILIVAVVTIFAVSVSITSHLDYIEATTKLHAKK